MILIALAAETSSDENNGAIIVAIIMGIVSVVGTVIGGWYTYRAARRNADVTREIEKDKLSTSSWEAQVEAWRTDVVALRQQRAEDRQEYNAHRLECAQKISDLTEKLANIAEAHDRDRREYRAQRLALEQHIDALVSWGREVVIIMRQRGITFPTPPPPVGETDPLGFDPIR